MSTSNCMTPCFFSPWAGTKTAYYTLPSPYNNNHEKSSSHLHNSLHQMDSPVIRLPTCETDVSTTTATAVPSASTSRIEMVPFTSITFFWLHSIDSVLLTVMGWPSRSWPCMLSMTASIVHSLLKLTKPKPRECWISVPLIGSPAFPTRFKKKLLTNRCCAPISGCLFQEDKVKSFNVVQPLCFLFLALLLLKSNASRSLGKFSWTQQLEPAFSLSQSPPLDSMTQNSCYHLGLHLFQSLQEH